MQVKNLIVTGAMAVLGQVYIYGDKYAKWTSFQAVETLIKNYIATHQ